MGRAEYHIIFAETKIKNLTVINCDSQAAILALDNTNRKPKSKITLDTGTLKTGREEPGAHKIDLGTEGNEHADTLAKRGANKTDATLLDAHAVDTQCHLGRGN